MIRVIGHVDEQHQLTAQVPPSVGAGPVQIVVFVPGADEDEAGAAWMAGVAHEWHAELSDTREDIYSLSDRWW